jgi:hypothetical protein
MDKLTQWRSVTGDFRLHGGTQLLDQLRVVRMRRRIAEGAYIQKRFAPARES